MHQTWAHTDPGRDPEKQVNEDAFALEVLPLGHLVIVCDGMGGHQGGKEASELAVEVIASELRDLTLMGTPGDLLRRAIQKANERVFTLGTHTPQARPGSTVVLCLFTETGLWIAHVGDSRAYRIRNGQVEILTRDHSAVRELVDLGLLSMEQAKHHPEANKITRALGVSETVDVEVTETPQAYEANDVFVLCSDGLSDLLEPKDFLEQIQKAGAQNATKALVALANERGGHDNITAVLVRTTHASRPITALLSASASVRSERKGASPQTEIIPRPADSRPGPTIMMSPADGPITPTLVPGRRLPERFLRFSDQPRPALAKPRSASFAVALIGAVATTALITAAAVLYLTGYFEKAKPSVVAPAPIVPIAEAPSATTPPMPVLEAPAPQVQPVPTLVPMKKPKANAD
jgi:PPM family protein phosphatase